ncbi:MAG: ABC transporter ATP-binding protein [Alphaproteobacteria bacterium]|nr:ABC transporter ATP-binding protein [Alphaproteobacteria bacterium]
MEEIKLRGVAKAYGRAPAVRDLDLTVSPGEFLTILGPSGCGKTTTLRIVAGLEDPDRGQVQLGSRLVFCRDQGILVPPEHRQLGLIFQSYALWPHMTVTKNITLALKEKRLPADEISRRLDDALERVQLGSMRERYPSELSGGQQQRVAVARLIALKPSILLMDEPLSNLDAVLRTEMRGELRRLHQDLRATTIYVTHDQVEALTLSDTIVVMNDGIVEQRATPYDIYHRPETLFVAEFIGDPRINRLDGRLTGDGRVEFGDFALGLGRDPSSKSGIIAGAVRPETISFSQSEKPGAIRVTIDSIQPTGSQTILHTSGPAGRYTVLQSGFVRAKPGDPAWIAFDPEAFNFFDPSTGRRLDA